LQLLPHEAVEATPARVQLQLHCYGVELYELFRADAFFKDVRSLDKSLGEKLSLIEQLDKKEKDAFYSVLDAFVGKKKLHDALKGVMEKVEG